ncbi:MAG TPA: hypothetical protein VEG34_02170 [Thermoanaerobaculia bacterium]|nr:hypothetical protein [Thermoanaerobaculia bacterium]
MKRTLLVLLVLLGITVLAASPPAAAAGCTTQTYCNFCPTADNLCCCEPGTAAVGQITSCNRRLLCQNECWGQPPGSCPLSASEIRLEVREAGSALLCSGADQGALAGTEVAPSAAAPR